MARSALSRWALCATLGIMLGVIDGRPAGQVQPAPNHPMTSAVERSMKLPSLLEDSARMDVHETTVDRCCVATERRLKRLALPHSIADHELLRGLYRFVGSHLDLMRQLPCFCGCDELGHGSAADCFVERSNDPSRAAWNVHAAGCGMCLAIARDAMRLQGQNVTIVKIQRHVEARYRPAESADRDADPRREIR